MGFREPRRLQLRSDLVDEVGRQQLVGVLRTRRHVAVVADLIAELQHQRIGRRYGETGVVLDELVAHLSRFVAGV